LHLSLSVDTLEMVKVMSHYFSIGQLVDASCPLFLYPEYKSVFNDLLLFI